MTWLFVGVGALFVAVAIPMIARRVPPNRFYGLRVPATFADQAVWYEANAKSGRDLVVLGVLQIAVAVGAAMLSSLDELGYVVLNVVVVSGGAVVVAIVGWMRANRLHRERGAVGHGTNPARRSSTR